MAQVDTTPAGCGVSHAQVINRQEYKHRTKIISRNTKLTRVAYTSNGGDLSNYTFFGILY